MAGEWRNLTVDEIKAPDDRAIAIGPFGSRMKADAYVAHGVPVIRGTNISDTRALVGDFVFVSDETADELRACNVFANDLVFPHRGAIGQVGVVPNDGATRYMLSTSLMKLTCNREVVEPLFVFYYFRSAVGRNALLERASTVGTPGIGQPLTSLRSILVPVPPLPEQRAIAHILGTLDDKIELNRRMSETLEAMARAIFKSWFGSFDTARAQAAEFVRDGVLEIGDGYRAKNSEIGEPGLPFIRAGNLNNGFDTRGAEVLHQDSVVKAGRKLSRPGDIAFTSKGTIGRVARVTVFTEPFVYSPQVCFWRSLDPERLQPAVLYCWMQSEDFKWQIDAVAGQTDMAPYVSLRDQRRMAVPVFPKSQQAIAGQLEPLLVRQAVAAEENKTLAALRDTLLPKLLSGEVRVAH